MPTGAQLAMPAGLKTRLRPTRGSDRVNGDPRPRVRPESTTRPRELGVEARHVRLRVAAAFDELTTAI